MQYSINEFTNSRKCISQFIAEVSLLKYKHTYFNIKVIYVLAKKFKVWIFVFNFSSYCFVFDLQRLNMRLLLNQTHLYFENCKDFRTNVNDNVWFVFLNLLPRRNISNKIKTYIRYTLLGTYEFRVSKYIFLETTNFCSVFEFEWVSLL